VAALFSHSCAFRLSAFTRLTGLSSFFGGGIVSFCGKHMLLDMLKNPKYICQNISRGPQGYPGGPNGPAAVLWDTQGGSRGNARSPRTQRLWGPRPNYRPSIAKATASQLKAARCESRHAVKLGEEDDGRLSPIVALLKLVMIRDFTTMHRGYQS
jgi:hypothetical protein